MKWWNEKIIEIDEALEDSGLAPEGANKTIQNEAKDQTRGFLITIS